MPSFTSSLLALSLAASAVAHQTIWSRSMYGVGWTALGANEDFEFDDGDPFAPLGPDWKQDDWWFRGPGARALPPVAGEVSELVAGGSITFEIACHVAWTSFGVSPTVPGSLLDACPSNSGAYHSGDPADDFIDDSLLSGCALGIADVDNIEDVTMDNLAIFSVNHECVKQKVTTFEIPERMPPCTGEKCICGWFWLANNGTGNFYMTAFDCNVTGSPADATPIMAPVDPNWCSREDWAAGTCTENTGAKRPLYSYNYPTNIVWQGNYDRPGYHARWGFQNNGAQNDIFEAAVVNTTTSSSTTSSATSTSVASSSSSSVQPTTSESASVSTTVSTTVAPTTTTTTSSVAPTTTTAPTTSVAVSSSSSASASSSSSVSPSISTSSSATTTTSVKPSSSSTTSTQTSSTSSSLAASSSSEPSSSSSVFRSSSSSSSSTSTTSVQPSSSSTTSTTVKTSSTSKAYAASSTGNIAAGATKSSSSSTVPSSSSSSSVPPSSSSTSSVAPTTTQAPSSSSSSSTSKSSPSAMVWSLVVTTTEAPKTTTTTQATSKTSTSAPTSAAAASATPVNLALGGSVQASTESTSSGQTAAKAIDGHVGGYPKSSAWEWATLSQTTGAWLKLSWDSAVTFNQIVLYDRPNTNDQILAGTLTFSDGSSVAVGELKNDGTATYIDLPSVTTSSIVLTVTKVSSTTSNVGLSEIQVYLADASKFTSTVSPTASTTSAYVWSLYNPKRVKPTTTTTSAKKASSTTSVGVKAAATASSAKESSTAQVWTLVPTGTVSTRRSIAERLSAFKRNIAARQRHARDFTSELDADELFE